MIALLGHDMATKQMVNDECEMGKNWIGGGILLNGVFLDLTQFNFHGLLFSQ